MIRIIDFLKFGNEIDYISWKSSPEFCLRINEGILLAGILSIEPLDHLHL